MKCACRFDWGATAGSKSSESRISRQRGGAGEMSTRAAKLAELNVG
jgi:hypothetical protein